VRDVATLVWVVLIIVGVVSSMISSVRRQVRTMPQRARPRSMAPGQAGLQAVAVQAPPRATPPRPAPTHAQKPQVQAPEAHRPRRFFGSKRDVVRAVIAAEVLGKPKALRGEDLPV